MGKFRFSATRATRVSYIWKFLRVWFFAFYAGGAVRKVKLKTKKAQKKRAHYLHEWARSYFTAEKNTSKLGASCRSKYNIGDV